MSTHNENQSNTQDQEHTPILETWRELCGCFSGVKYAANRPKDMWGLFTRRYVGDITRQWNLSYWKKARTLLIPLEDSEIDYLRVLAQQRLETSAMLFRAWAVSSVTIPVSILVIANQLFPEWIQANIFDDGNVFSISRGVLTGFGVILLTNLMYIFLNVFKAREMRSALELVAADRRLKRGETIVSAGGDAVDVSL